ncbi:MAG: glycerol dehydrogenase, partial [Lachnospiraceae bacterium]|nr:glycerol dehydrogenase [Lachnospiraceae bacterium]
MANAIKLPGQYIQGPGELKNLGKYIKKMGKKFLILLSENSKKRFESIVSASLQENELDFIYEATGPQCSLPEIERVTEVGKSAGCDAVISLGGGKIIDIGKAVATYLAAVSIIVPTVASNDSPCSGLSVVYNDEGVVVKVIYSKRNPDLVLVDSEVIAAAPPRFFAAGVADALATYFEARACKASGARNMARGSQTDTAEMMAKLCNDILFEYGSEAKKAIEEKKPNEALEHVLEACTLLSGVGFESGGLAAAHAINDGFAYVPAAQGAMHGEKVS